jgi:hypothetical protein
MRRGAAIALVPILLCAVRDANGQPQVQAERQTADAEALTTEGLVLRRQRRDAEALADFRQAYAIRPTPRTLAQIALAEQALGRWADAEAHLRAALQAQEDPWIEPHRQVLAAGLADIETHLGQLEIEADVSGAELWVNGMHAGSLPLREPLRVEAGSVVIEVRAPAYASAQRHTSVEAGETAHETIHLVPLPPARGFPNVVETPPGRPEPPRSKPEAAPFVRVIPMDRPMRTASLVLLGAGAAGWMAGAYFGVRTLDSESNANHFCPQSMCRDQKGAQAIALDREARSFADRSTAWFVWGAVAAAAGAGLYWLSRSRTLPGKSTAFRVEVDDGLRGVRVTVKGAW